MNNLPKVLIAAPVHPVLTEGLEAAGYRIIRKEAIVQSEAAALLKDCEGVITSTRLKLDRQLLDAAPALRWIGRMGSGMEIIDVEYAKSRGIGLHSSPEGNRNAVAEHTVGLLLSVLHRIAWSWNEVRAGQWLREENRGGEAEGRTIGIIGFGNTGRALTEKLQGFGMRILCYDKYDSGPVPPYCEKAADLTMIHAEADIVSFHVPLQADTHHYVNESFIKSMRKPFLLLNTSRGEVIDTSAVIDGLERGQITGLGADVWAGEPLERMDVIQKTLLDKALALSQVVITPHIAGYTREALYKMSLTLLNKIIMK